MGEFEDLPKYVKEGLREKAVNVKPIGRQSGIDRFPILREKDGHEVATRDQLPPIKEWRLNLTALSKVYNLYFVAYSDRIYVYRPNFPDQSLPSEPAIILNPIQTPDATKGYIDTEDPHSINHMIIDFLGNLEILLIACDDGDVIGYYTHRIEDAINRLSTKEEEEELSFCAFNVEMSAWGLAIHTRSRKLAISSNTECITIFAMGLVCEDDPPRPISKEKVEWHKSLLKDPKWRGDDQKFVYGRWGNNIPSVAFCNNDEDIEGKLLAFGELEGNIYILDLHKMKPVESIQVGFCREMEQECQCGEGYYPHATWGLSWLDRNSFHTVSRQMSPYHPSRKAYTTVWDGSEKKMVIPDANSHAHFSFWPSKTTGDSPPQIVPSGHIDEDEGAYSFIAAMTRAAKEREALWVNNDDDMCDVQDLKWQSENYSFGEKALGIQTRNMDGDSTPEISSLGEIPLPDPNHRDANYPCPLFVTSKKDACLIQPKDHMNRLTPIIGYLDPLEQWAIMKDDMEQTPWFHSDNAMDRLSLQTYIPELGAVFVGSPKGRVGIFTLCQSNDKKEGSPVYFHRLDWILPLESQENAGDRPLSKLIGIAVGPVQGHLGMNEGGAKSRKWRLMMHYKDHAILSYEITREDEEVVWKDGPKAHSYRYDDRARRAK